MNMIKILILITVLLTFSSCGKDGDAVAPGSNGSTIGSIKANCRTGSCI